MSVMTSNTDGQFGHHSQGGQPTIMSYSIFKDGQMSQPKKLT